MTGSSVTLSLSATLAVVSLSSSNGCTLDEKKRHFLMNDRKNGDVRMTNQIALHNVPKNTVVIANGGGDAPKDACDVRIILHAELVRSLQSHRQKRP